MYATAVGKAKNQLIPKGRCSRKRTKASNELPSEKVEVPEHTVIYCWLPSAKSDKTLRVAGCFRAKQDVCCPPMRVHAHGTLDQDMTSLT